MGSTCIDRKRIVNALKYDAERVRRWREASMMYPKDAVMRRNYECALSDFGREVMRCRMMNGHIAAMRGWVKS